MVHLQPPSKRAPVTEARNKQLFGRAGLRRLCAAGGVSVVGVPLRCRVVLLWRRLFRVGARVAVSVLVVLFLFRVCCADAGCHQTYMPTFAARGTR